MRKKLLILFLLVLTYTVPGYGQGVTVQNSNPTTAIANRGTYIADSIVRTGIGSVLGGIPSWWNMSNTFNGALKISSADSQLYWYFNGWKKASGGGGSTSITVGTTPILSGTTGRVPFNNSGIYGEDPDLTWGASGILTPTLGVGNSTSSSTGTIAVGGSGTGIGNITGGGGGLNVNGGDLNLAPDPTHVIKFTTNNIERARILNNGNMGVGASAPDSLFQVSGGGLWANGGVRLSGLPTGLGTKALRIDASGVLSVADTTTSSSGDVAGPASATDNALTRFDGTTGKLVQNSNLTLSDGGTLTLAGQPVVANNPGQLYYNTDEEALEFQNNEPDVALQIGQESWIRVRNESGSTISNGAAVYINGSHAGTGLPTVALAQANAASTTIVAGLATHDIENNTIGYVTSIGSVRGLNTSAFTNGQTVFLSATTPGALISTAPSAPNFRYRVGIISKAASGTAGSIHVTPTTAALGNGTANQVFGINNAGTAQEVKSIVGSNGITVTNTANTITTTLGGALTGATTITTTGSNTLALSGLQSGTASDSVLVANATTGVIRRRATSTLAGWGLTGNAGTSYTTNYIGTSDNVNLAFRVNNVKSGFIEGAATGNTGFGYNAAAGTLSSFNNSAFGYNAARDLTSGQNNTILGSMAGQAITTASSCTFVGFQIARLANASGNTAVGNQSLFSLTSGINNCGLGNQSLYSLTTGASNLGIGSLACYSLGSAGFNVGIGQEALFSNTAGFYNAAVGTSALYSTTGQYNVALGHQAGYSLTSGSQCLFLGNFAGPNISNTADGQANLNNGLFGAGLTSTSAASPAGRWSIGTQTPDATALLYIAGQMKAVNYVANSAAPSAIVGPGAGATGSVSVSAAGSNHNYQVTVTVAGATATGNVAVMTMSGGFSVSTAMHPVMSPVNDAAKALSGTQQVGIDGSTTTHTITSGTVALLPGTYIWNVICLPK